jgi:hypothetical protein
MKTVTATATVSARAKELLENRQTAKEISSKMLKVRAGKATTFSIKNYTFRTDRPVVQK